MLLEHGQQIGDPYLGSLMFVMALEMLFMAGGISTFKQRLGGFLGLDSRIFPQVTEEDHQPTTTVREMIDDLYKFRNIIAHGQEVPKQPYRELHDLISACGQRVVFIDFPYAELMLESGLFMLATALRRIFTEDFFEYVADSKRWRRKLKNYEDSDE